MGILIFDFIVCFIILLAIHAPWWAWVIYGVCTLVGLVIWALKKTE